ncbi:MAG: type II toxin-antitoxin system HicB family antitoxin [Spirochaetia bacterium]|jgi:antitoxin HicB|nr:type II toxin-antitoxin system HicB family antitoxin [Spirochaetia bacterium]
MKGGGMVYHCRLEKTDSMVLVSFPDLPDIQTYGETIDSALLNAKEALNGCLASDVSRGLLPPDPVFHDGDSIPIEVAPHVLISIQLRKLRGEQSQTEIASRLNVSYQSYQTLENPVKCNPTIRNLERVAQAMGKRLIIQIV